MPRISWRDLPPNVLDAVEALGGSVRAAHDAEAGAGSDVAAHVYLDHTDGVFIKGARHDGPHHEPLKRELLMGAHHLPCAPRLQWHIDTAGWLLLGYEIIRARMWADLAPGSPDVPLVAAALNAVGSVNAPRELPGAWQRWHTWCDPEDENLFRGEQLVHTDPAATNFMVDDTRAWVIDWAWPVRGPAWIDPMLWGFRLVTDGGHTPQQAARVIRQLDGYHTSTRRSRAALTQAEARSLEQTVSDSGNPPEAAGLVTDAYTWAEYWAID